ncbi:MAG: hypothetical protein K940chlam7_01784 [Chlamydiae bacterium]|nr:hypothetical protein [Chlamydiota bacterium]
MTRIAAYSLLLLAGMFISQILDLSSIQHHLSTVTMVCLAYITIEVGLEFTLDKKNLSSYGVDYLIAMTAAAFPWIFCSFYFFFVLDINLQESLLIGRFAAPTSAGILFTMLAAAGLGTTWLFKKVRILAIFDDLDTIILMIPLQIMVVGFRREAVVLVALVIALFVLAYRYLHTLRIPASRIWLIYYSVLVVGLCQIVEESIHVNFEVLLPAFALGCIIFNPHDPTHPERYKHEHYYIEPQQKEWRWLDYFIKNSFMFLVGCTLPKVNIATIGLWYVVGHVTVLTILSNLGKMFPALCYKTEATKRERLALSIALFPRGEVGAGVLILALEFGLQEKAITLGGLSLALNLALTGFFIIAVIKLIEPLHQTFRAK